MHCSTKAKASGKWEIGTHPAAPGSKADFKLAETEECFTDEDEENGLCLKFV